MIESRLWQIPMSEAAFSDRVPDVIESEDTKDLYDFYAAYADSMKAKARERQ